jgi:ABC-type multidrug transport system fused ATPase/permease subunit
MDTRKLSPGLILGFIAAALSVFSGVLSARVNSWYLESHPFYGDTSSYYFITNRIYWESKFNGAWPTILKELNTNARNPLKTIPLLILNPEWLGDPNGHIIVGSFMLFCFLALLGITIFKRTQSLPYSIAGMSAFLTAQAFFDPTLGLGANYPDLHASYLSGAALLALVNSEEARRPKWLILFGIFFALASLARFVSAGYTAVICGPILGFYLIKRWRQKDTLIQSVILPLVWVIAPILILSGFYFWKFTPGVLHFYSVAGYSLKHPVGQVLLDIGRLYKLYMGAIGYVVLLLFAFFYFFRNWSLRKSLSSLIVTIWAAIAQLILVVFILRVSDDPWVLFYILPGLYLLALAPFNLDQDKIKELQFKILNWKWMSVILVALTGIIIKNYQGIHQKYNSPADLEKADLIFQKKVTHEIIQLTKGYDYRQSSIEEIPSFDTFFYAYGRSIVNEATFKYKKPLRWLQCYDVHPGGWKLRFPRETFDEIKEQVFQDALKNLDFIFILANPKTKEAEASYFFNNELSIQVVEDMNRRLANSPNLWSKESSLKSPWGDVLVYRNLKRYHLLEKSRD